MTKVKRNLLLAVVNFLLGNEPTIFVRVIKEKQNVAERGFDPGTSGLWAQHASTAPFCFS